MKLKAIQFCGFFAGFPSHTERMITHQRMSIPIVMPFISKSYKGVRPNFTYNFGSVFHLRLAMIFDEIVTKKAHSEVVIGSNSTCED